MNLIVPKYGIYEVLGLSIGPLFGCEKNTDDEKNDLKREMIFKPCPVDLTLFK
jgi:hypothetical protein